MLLHRILGDRLMVGQGPLKPLIMVRVHVSQPRKIRSAALAHRGAVPVTRIDSVEYKTTSNLRGPRDVRSTFCGAQLEPRHTPYMMLKSNAYAYCVCTRK